MQFIALVIGPDELAKSGGWLADLPDDRLLEVAQTLTGTHGDVQGRFKQWWPPSTATIAASGLFVVIVVVGWLLIGPAIFCGLAWLHLPVLFGIGCGLLFWRSHDVWHRFLKAFEFRPWVVVEIHFEVISNRSALRQWASQLAESARNLDVPIVIWYPPPMLRGTSTTPGSRVLHTGGMWVCFPINEGSEHIVQRAFNSGFPLGTSSEWSQSIKTFTYVRNRMAGERGVWLSPGKSGK